MVTKRAGTDALDRGAFEAAHASGGHCPAAAPAAGATAGREVPSAPGKHWLLGHLPLLRRGILPALVELRAAGPVVTVQAGTGSTYVVNDGALAHEILVDKNQVFGKERMIRGFQAATGDGLNTLEWAEHQERRRIVTPAFGRASTAHAAPLICQVAADFARRWPVGTPLEMDREMLKLSADITVRCLFRSEADPDTMSWLATKMSTLSKGVMLRMAAPAWCPPLPTPESIDRWRAKRRVRQVVQGLRERHTPTERRDDLLSLLNAAACPAPGAPGIPSTVVSDELVTFLGVGSETIGVALAWAWHELARNRDLEQAVQREADALFNSGNPLPEKVDEHLPLSTQVVMEALRLYPLPVVPRNALREVTVGGFRFPRGADVLLNLYGIHRDPALHPRPDTFDPYRWAPESARTALRNAYLPYGAGAHRCVAAPFAALSGAIALATLAAQFQLRPADPHCQVRAVAGVVTRPDRLVMTATPRTGKTI
ncbi:cytochrome P450 [Streptomyces sp. NPDC090741]|uniref:cytochrome P450 n=1 Tax=Streptomyces sp. NPDC090741 TaxID=3365967 RepID=UPI003809869E